MKLFTNRTSLQWQLTWCSIDAQQRQEGGLHVMNTAASTVSARPPRCTTAPLESGDRNNLGQISTPNSSFWSQLESLGTKAGLVSFPFILFEKKQKKQQTLHISTTPPWKSRVESCFPSPRPMLITGERSGLRHVKLLLPTLDTFATISAAKSQLSFAVLRSVEKQNLLRMDQ